MCTTVALVSSAITYLAGVCSHVETSEFECMDCSTSQFRVLKVATEGGSQFCGLTLLKALYLDFEQNRESIPSVSRRSSRRAATPCMTLA